jgi:hypothetical protein
MAVVAVVAVEPMLVLEELVVEVQVQMRLHTVLLELST